MKGKNIAAIVLVGIGGADLLMGNTDHPLPLVGQYLTQQMDMILIAAGLAVYFFL